MEQYISIKQIIDDLMEHPLLRKLSFERVVNHTVHFIRIVGCPKIFNEKTAIVEINNYRGTLPCDVNKIIQVRTNDEEHRRFYDVLNYGTDSFFASHSKEDYKDATGLVYKVQGGIIFTSIKNGNVEIAYNSMAVDDEGYPMIPDDSSFIRALELYIRKQVLMVMFETGQLTQQVYNNICQEYAWAVGQASTSLIKPSIDQMEALTNSLNTLIPRVNEHRRGFKHLGVKEKIKVK